MIRLDESTVRRTLALIERYDLHGDEMCLPVAIRQVAKDEGWDVAFRPGMGKARAMAFLVRGVQLMYVNENLTSAEQRCGIAHEMGHVLARHMVGIDVYGARSLRLASVAEWQEAEAQLIAGMLTIPACLKDSPILTRDVAKMCVVPQHLVRLYREAMPAERAGLRVVA